MEARLDNGLQVVLQENRSAPVVALQMWVRSGSADDPPGAPGLAHVIEHMVFKGTARRGEGQIALEVEGAGGLINAWTAHDQTVYHVVMASRFFDAGLDILADALQNPRLDDAELARERSVIAEEIRMGQDAPGKAVGRALFAAAYRKHPYRRPVIGTVASVARVSRDDLRAYYRRHYVPANMTLVVVGDVDPQRALARIRAAFAKGGGPPPERVTVREPEQRALRVAVRDHPGREVYVTMGFHIPGLMDEQTPLMDLGGVILGEGESSRLVRELLHGRQVVTSVHAYAYTPREPGLFVVGATATRDKLDAAVEALCAEAFRLGAAEVSAEELSRARTMVQSETVYQKETVQGQARKLGFFKAVAGDTGFERVYGGRVRAATPAELRRVAARFLRPENLSVAVVAPGAGGRDQQDKVEARVRRAVDRAWKRAAKAAAFRVDEGRGQVTRVTLESGARLLVLRDSTVPLVSMRAVWLAGARFEDKRSAGIHSLLASLVTRGTRTRGADSINEEMEHMAGVIAGFSGQNSFGVQAELLSEHWERGLELLADCVLSPAFPPDEVERAKLQAVEDIMAQRDNPAAAAMRLFARTLYRSHPYRNNPMGTPESVAALSRDDLLAHYARTITPGRMVLAVVGDVDEKRVIAAFRRLFAAAPAGGSGQGPAPLPRIAREPLPRAPRSALSHMDRKQAHVVVGYPGTTVRSRDRFALEVLAALLSGQSGRLFMELRERRGLVYQVAAFSVEGVDPGYLSVYAATSPARVEAAAAAIDEQLAALREAPVDSTELERVKRHLVGTFEISLQRRSTVAALLSFNEVYGVGHRAYTRYADAVLAVTAKDVQRVAQKYLVPTRRVVAVVQPEQLSPGAQKALGTDRTPGVVNPDAPKPKRRRRR